MLTHSLCGMKVTEVRNVAITSHLQQAFGGLMARFMPLFTLPDGVCAALRVSMDNDFQQVATRKIVPSVYSWRREAKVEVRQNWHSACVATGKKKKVTEINCMKNVDL